MKIGDLDISEIKVEYDTPERSILILHFTVEGIESTGNFLIQKSVDLMYSGFSISAVFPTDPLLNEGEKITLIQHVLETLR